MQNRTKVLFGVILVSIGSLVLVNNLGILDLWGTTLSTMLSYFWPIVFLGLGITFIFDKNFPVGVILSLIGVALLLSRLLSWGFWSTFWPFILIGLGVSILFKKEEKVSINNTKKTSTEDTLNDTVIFWGADKKVESKNFKGGEINTVMGGYKLDLRDVKLSKGGAKLNINCAFGGVEIFVSDNYRVKTNGIGVLGGWSPEMSNNDKKEPILEINGVAAFGAVEIKD